MIYRVVLDDTTDIHTSDIDCMLLNPSLELEMNSAGSFTFTLPPRHPNWNDVKVLKSTIDVYEDNELIFTGRVASIEKNWNNERVVTCEGALAYFNDSIHRQNKWSEALPIASEDPNVHNFLKDILDNHNAFVGDADNRKIYIGHIYISPELVTREVDYDTTLDILTRMCIDTNGGYFQVRKNLEDGKLYLDWLKDFTDESSQPAEFGLNLLDFNTSLNAEDICTGVLARGATIDDQVITLSNVELVDENTYPDMSVTHLTTQYSDILWHRNGKDMFGQVVQIHDFPDATVDWKRDGHIVQNSLFEMAKKWLEEKNTKVETIEVEVAELSWLGEGEYGKFKLGQIVQINDTAHMAGESETTRKLPMYKMSCDLTSGSKKVTLGTPPKKELTQISASNSDSSTLSSGNSSGSSSGGGSGSGEECKVHDVRVDGTSVVTNKIANINLSGKADVSTVNALANTVATKADTSTVNALANMVSGKQDQINFNTAEAATEVLTRLKADGVVYNLGGGTEVEANPSETATDDLETIKIGDTVYDIPGSGGGSTNYGKFNCELIFNTATQSSGWSDSVTVCTKDVLDEYDAIYVTDGMMTNGTIRQETKFVLIKDIESIGDNGFQYMFGTDPNGTSFFVFGLRVYNNNLIWYSDRNGGYLFKVYGIKFENKLINRSDIYSEEERMIGRWTDGKPLYQLTVHTGALSTGSNYFDLPSCMNDRETIVDINGTCYTHDYDGQYVSIHNAHTQGNYYIRAGILDTGKLFVECGTAYPMDTSDVTIQYTKTTDAPNSGFLPEDPQMVMMSDYYSEDEQVVGRWTDGKPLYQKTFKPTSALSNGSWNSNILGTSGSGISIKNVDGLFYGSGYLELKFPLSYYRSTSEFSTLCTNNTGDDINLLPKIDGIGSLYVKDVTVKYTKTTDAPGTGPTKGNLIYLPALYSEEEREVGVWTDGKPLYQKTAFVPAPTGSTNAWFNHNISGLTDAEIKHFDYDIYFSDPSVGKNGYAASNYQFQVLRVSNTQIYFIGGGWTTDNYKIHITIQYTKTTDQPGSGTWTPEGQLAHHYSTSEHIVGTWVDGSTVYERTWDFSSNPIQLRYDTWIDSTIPSSAGVAKVIDCKCLNPGYLTIPGVEAAVGAGYYPVGLDYCCNTAARAVGYLTLRYTKSS